MSFLWQGANDSPAWKAFWVATTAIAQNGIHMIGCTQLSVHPNLVHRIEAEPDAAQLLYRQSTSSECGDDVVVSGWLGRTYCISIPDVALPPPASGDAIPYSRAVL